LVQKEIIILCENGIHARPASQIVKRAREFKSNITLIHNDKEFTAISIMSVMKMAVDKGEKVIVIAKGIDEQQALDGMVKLLLYEIE